MGSLIVLSIDCGYVSVCVRVMLFLVSTIDYRLSSQLLAFIRIRRLCYIAPPLPSLLLLSFRPYNLCIRSTLMEDGGWWMENGIEHERCQLLNDYVVFDTKSRLRCFVGLALPLMLFAINVWLCACVCVCMWSRLHWQRQRWWHQLQSVLAILGIHLLPTCVNRHNLKRYNQKQIISIIIRFRFRCESTFRCQYMCLWRKKLN